MIYELHRSTADPALWFLYERYESQEHLNRHRENPVLRSFIADAATLLDGKLDIRTFRVIAARREEHDKVYKVERHVSAIGCCHRVVRNERYGTKRNGQMSTCFGYPAQP